MFKRLLILAVFALTPLSALAHCPLCTIGAGAAAIGAMWLGISVTAIGIFIGAFAVAIGSWVSRLIKKQLIPYQEAVLIVLSFVTTVLPLKGIMADYYGIYIPFLGVYGTTLAINKFILGSLIGGIILVLSPKASRWVTRKRGKTIQYQGIMITFALLLIIATLIEIIL